MAAEFKAHYYKSTAFFGPEVNEFLDPAKAHPIILYIYKSNSFDFEIKGI